jgi:hypothetical protein
MIISLTEIPIRDSATRFQLPKISPSDFGPHESVQTDEGPSHEEVEIDTDSEPAGDSSVLLSDLLDHLEEAAALSPGPILQSTVTASSGPLDYFSIAEAEAETEADSLESGQSLATPEDSPPLEGSTPGCTLIESYQELVEKFPLDATSEIVATQKNSIDSQSVASCVFDTGLEVNPPVTPKKQRKSSTSAPVLSPTFFGPFPTPFSHRQFIAPSPSGSLRSPSSSSACEPTSPSPLPRLSLKRKDSTRPRRHISDIFKQRQASAKH